MGVQTGFVKAIISRAVHLQQCLLKRPSTAFASVVIRSLNSYPCTLNSKQLLDEVVICSHVFAS